MKIHTAPVIPCVILLSVAHFQSARAQSLFHESGTSILAPSTPPVGGLALNPQEYLTVAWTVNEADNDIYTYSYTVENPAGDVLLTPTKGLTTTPEVFDAFSVDFNTTEPGAYLAGTQTGGAFQEANTVDLAWFLNPEVPAGSSVTVSFESDFGPTLGNANAQDAVPPSPWSSVSLNGQPVPVPLPLPEPSCTVLLTLAGLMAWPGRTSWRRVMLRKD
jgi:hypothetical protein